MHSSDDDLLAYRDGELRFVKRARVRRHLESCWQCRTRSAALENQIQKLAEKSENWGFPAPQWVAFQKSLLGSRILEIETGRQDVIDGRVFRPARILWPAAAAIVFALAIFALWPRKSVAPALVAKDAIGRVENAENALYLRPVEQNFTVRIMQILPVRSSSDSQLEIWSDRSTNRFASRWTGSGGTLKHALWQPAAGAEFVYQPRGSHAPVKKAAHTVTSKPLLSLADGGLEPGQLERSFMQWMESRSWTPVAFTPELSMWTRRDGAVAGAVMIHDADGSPLVRITARQQNPRVTAILTVDVDPRTWWPRRQSIRFESQERSVEFHLTSNRIRSVRSSELTAAVFQPDFASSSIAASTVGTMPSLPSLPETPREVDASPAIADRAIETVEAHYILHELAACLGETVKIEEESGALRVYNIGRASGGLPRTALYATLQDVSGALADLRRPLPADLEDTEARVPASAFRHAWALRNLVVDFTPNRVAGLPETSWHLLESMLHDHIAGLRRELGLPVPNSRGTWRADPVGSEPWRQSAASLFDRLLHIRDEPSSVPVSFDELDTKLDFIASSFAAESAGSKASSGRIKP